MQLPLTSLLRSSAAVGGALRRSRPAGLPPWRRLLGRALVLLSCAAAAQSGRAVPTGPPRTVPQGAIRGDFDGDGVAEYVWLVPPQLPAADSDGFISNCVGPCTSVLRCSNPAWKPYRLPQSIGGDLARLAYLRGGRRDYLGIQPQWFTSCWSEYYVLTYQQGRWQYATPPFTTYCSQWEAPAPPVERDRAAAGRARIHYATMGDDGVIIKTKSVPLK